MYIFKASLEQLLKRDFSCLKQTRKWFVNVRRLSLPAPGQSSHNSQKSQPSVIWFECKPQEAWLASYRGGTERREGESVEVGVRKRTKMTSHRSWTRSTMERRREKLWQGGEWWWWADAPMQLFIRARPLFSLLHINSCLYLFHRVYAYCC